MKRLVLIIATAALLVTSIPRRGSASGPFDQRLSQDKQIVQALNRLTFGPRPGDAEEVRRLGVTKWIELQLHPDRIPENPALDAKLKPLETLRMDLREIVEKYTPQPQLPVMMRQPLAVMNTLLSPEEMRKVQIGTAEERTAVLRSLDPGKRKQVLASLPPNVLEHTPEFQKEGEDARKMQQEEAQKENRRRNPQLNDLLNPDQMNVARSGNKEQLTALFAYLDPEKRPLVAGLLPPLSLAALPELRRDGQVRRAPRQVVSEDLKEAKVFRALYSNRQLEEVLVDFWFNHFNVDQAKNLTQLQNQVHLLIGSYERERGILNGVPNSILPSPLGRQAHGLNENYGREVMELHTLGVKGGYTQDDVIAVARCFTGWTVRDPNNPEFVFASFMHDFGEKTVLGHKFAAGGGEQDGLQAIDILAHHPSTAKFIAKELAQRFVADDPPQALVDRMAQTFAMAICGPFSRPCSLHPSFSPKAHGRPRSNHRLKWS